MELLALGYQGLVKGRIVVTYHLIEDGQTRTLGLKNHQAPLAFASCTATYLGHHHKSMFICPEVRIVEHGVSIKDSHDTNLIEIETL